MTASTMTFNLSPAEMQALDQLALEHDMSKTAVLRQALRLYQSLHHHLKNGERIILSGDAQRALDFVGPGFGQDLRNPSPAPNLLALSEDQIAAVLHLVESRLCIIWAQVGAREAFANELRVLEPISDDEAELCTACDVPFEDGDMVYWNSDDTGHLHAGCCGPERECYVNADGEPLKDGEPIPAPFAWRAGR